MAMKDWNITDHPEAIDYINKMVNARIPFEVKKERQGVVFVRTDRKLDLVIEDR